MQLHCTHLLLNEAHLVETENPTYKPDSERVARFHTCLGTLKQWMETFLRIPLPSYLGFTFFSMCGLAYNLLVLFRFSTSQDPSWDKDLVKKSANILEISDVLINNYNHVAKGKYISQRRAL